MTKAKHGRATFDERFAKSPHGSKVGAEPGQPLTLTDIPAWAEVMYEGEVWLVSNIADDIAPQNGLHLELWSMDSNRVAIIHEDWVDFWLQKRRKIHPLLENAPA